MEGLVERVDHLLDRGPGLLAPFAMALLVGLERSQDGHRMHARPADPLAISELPENRVGRLGHWRDQADPGHGREVADHRHERHLREESRPDLRAGAELCRNRLPRQPVLSHEPGCLGCRSRPLQLLEALDLPQRVAVSRQKPSRRDQERRAPGAPSHCEEPRRHGPSVAADGPLVDPVALDDPPGERLHGAVHGFVGLEDPASLGSSHPASSDRVPDVAVEHRGHARVLVGRLDAQREHPDVVDPALVT